MSDFYIDTLTIPTNLHSVLWLTLVNISAFCYNYGCIRVTGNSEELLDTGWNTYEELFCFRKIFKLTGFK